VWSLKLDIDGKGSTVNSIQKIFEVNEKEDTSITRIISYKNKEEEKDLSLGRVKSIARKECLLELIKLR